MEANGLTILIALVWTGTIVLGYFLGREVGRDQATIREHREQRKFPWEWE